MNLSSMNLSGATQALRERPACAIGGAALLALGAVARRSPLLRGLSTAAGGALLYRAFRDVGTSRGGAHAAKHPHVVSQSVEIDAGRDTTYRYWRDLSNLPHVMQHLESVEEFSALRSRWRARGPAGVPVEWESEIIDDDPGKSISWRTVSGPIPHSGVVRFDDITPEWGTRVTVEMRYTKPVGAAADLLAHFGGESPEQKLASDLQRLKSLLEQKQPVTNVG